MKQHAQTNPILYLSASNTWLLVLCIWAIICRDYRENKLGMGATTDGPSPIMCSNLESTFGSREISSAYTPVILFMTCRELVCVRRVDGV